MDDIVIISQSMLMLGDFENWDFCKNKMIGITAHEIYFLQQDNMSDNLIIQKKAKRALHYIFNFSEKFKILNSQKSLISLAKTYNTKLYIGDLGEFLWTTSTLDNGDKERCVYYVQKEYSNIPVYSEEYWSVLNNSTNNLRFKNNQYFIIKDKNQETLFKYVKNDNDDTYEQVPYQSLKSNLFGETKPKKTTEGFVDPYQLAAIDSLKNNQMTMLTGKSGTGKSHLAIAALFDKMQKHQIDKIYMFCNPVATRDSARIGLYPGSKNEKLLDSQIGNFLDGKIGDRIGVEQLINDGKLVLLPMSDIRGFDSSGKKAGIYITEAQNSTIDLMQLALERVGEDCICIIDGDFKKQVDLDVYSDINNGMRRVSQVYMGQPFYGEVCLSNVYRSKIAELASKMKEY